MVDSMHISICDKYILYIYLICERMNELLYAGTWLSREQGQANFFTNISLCLLPF
jgi:hypothetical protein